MAIEAKALLELAKEIQLPKEQMDQLEAVVDRMSDEDKEKMQNVFLDVRKEMIEAKKAKLEMLQKLSGMYSAYKKNKVRKVREAEEASDHAQEEIAAEALLDEL